ncbi:hypothetical protein J1N35_038541 [Gossypium stocksii]|uniref:DUF4283 domain-containing protein n=1 Tax=Gossypium stocksii TaxID=47602 RepID=A0A9D3UM37_9ROSI|nr:hypothetical protein J1N35_038541 [Gossypium stocksii]
MEEELANLNLIDEEEDAFHEEAMVVDQNYQFNLVGQCLTDSVVHFPSLRNTMDDFWHPIVGCVFQILEKKRKKKIQICKDRTVYARFQYEKLSLFCFIYGYRQKILTMGIDNWQNMDSRELNGADSDNEPMDLVLTKENNPLLSMDGKKQQQVEGDMIIFSGTNIEGGLQDIMASSVGQSS